MKGRDSKMRKGQPRINGTALGQGTGSVSRIHIINKFFIELKPNKQKMSVLLDTVT